MVLTMKLIAFGWNCVDGAKARLSRGDGIKVGGDARTEAGKVSLCAISPDRSLGQGKRRGSVEYRL
jgi:hypothetical protein